MTIDYSEYENLPNYIKDMSNPWEFLNQGTCLLESYNNKFSTSGNKKDVRDIILLCFGVDIENSKHIKIYVSEFKKVFIDFIRFKINVFIDVD